MTIEKTSRNYELLIRYNEDGKIGAHLQAITRITEAGALIAAPTLDAPRQLSLGELKSIVGSLVDSDWFVPAVSD